MLKLGSVFHSSDVRIHDDLTQLAKPSERPAVAALGNAEICVSIIGAGNGGCALAADLMSRGMSVCLYAHLAHATRFDGIVRRGTLTAKGTIKGDFQPALMTQNIAQALSFADTVMVAVPSYAQEELFILMSPHLTHKHIVVNLNGNFGSLVLLQKVEKVAPVLLETNVVPHASRLGTDGVVTVLGTKRFVTIGSLPAETPLAVNRVVSTIFPCQLEWCPDVLAVAFQSNNGVLHPAASVLNSGWIESKKGNFYFYKDGISRAVGRVIEKIDSERIEIGRRYGFELRSLLDEMLSFYGGDYASISEFALKTKLHNKIKEAPSDTQHRYISEDVPFALVPWYELGRVVDFDAKTMRSIIDLAATINNVDYLATGRNLRQLGLSGMDRRSILAHAKG